MSDTFKDLVKYIYIPIKNRFRLPKECLTKTQYKSIKKVEIAAIRHNLKPYMCPHCKYYHLSTK